MAAIAADSVDTARLHDDPSSVHRMPVILDPTEYDLSLDPTNHDVETLNLLLRPYPDEEMIAYPVTTVVNNPRNNSVESVKPL